MNWLTKIFSAPKAINNVLDKDNGLLTQIGGWAGNMNFTDEERAKMNERMVDNISEFVKASLTENTERSLTRRMIAVLWIKVQLALILIVMMVAPFDMELAVFYSGIVFGTLMLSGTLSIIAFFFGAYMLGAHMGLNKNGKK